MTEPTRPLLRVIIASMRPGRLGLPIATWFRDLAIEHGAFDVQVTDLLELNLPFMDEPIHPVQQQYSKQHTIDWSALVANSDAFVWVMPEYNHSYTAAQKNAIDFLVKEWAFKPVGLVSYGGISGGLRAVQALKPVLSGLRMVPLSEAVVIQFASTLIDDSRVFQPTDAITRSVNPMLDELARQSPVLKQLRS